MIPVILIHKGYQEYLNYSINQSLKNNRVFLIGDTPIKNTDSKFTFIQHDGLLDGVQDFSKIYVHMNTTPPDYELFCYTRWFMIRNFMHLHNFEVVFYIDSDVLFFENAGEEWSKFRQYDMTLLHRTAGISSFVTKRGIDNFCDMLTEIYSKKDEYHFNKIASHFKIRQDFKLPGGVCDMTLLEYFHYHAEFGGGPGRIGEMMTIIDGSTYDHNINAKDQDFDFKHGVKSVKIINHKPYVFNKKIKKDIRFNSLHFQGSAKNKMGNIYDRCVEK